MANYLSPGVYTKEEDLTGIVPGVSTSVGAHVGAFNWGPVNQPFLLSDEGELVEYFGRPTDATANSFFTVANFLGYSRACYVVRALTPSMVTANTDGDATVLIQNSDHYEIVEPTLADAVTWAAKYPGNRANAITISMADNASFQRTLTGSVAVAEDSAVLTGTGTEFLTELSVGSIVRLTVGATQYDASVVSIASDLAATVDVTFPATQTGITAAARWQYADQFEYAPGTTEFAADRGATNDELHIVVIDGAGVFSGTPGSILEKYVGYSKAANAVRFDGSGNYYKNALNRNSRYLWWANHPSVAAGAVVDAVGLDAFGDEAAFDVDFAVLSAPYTATLSGGVNGSDTVTDANIIAGLELLSNDEEYNISLLMCGKATSTVANYAIQNVAEIRKDLMAFVSCFDEGDTILGSSSLEMDKLVDFRNTLTSSSYGVLDTGVKYQYDRYNDVFRWVPMTGDVAGLCARTDATNDPWFSPGGFNRGRLQNVAKLGVQPNQAQRDKIYPQGINPVVMFPGEGPILFGDRTLQVKPSAFDRINVRRLFIVLKKSIAAAAKYQLFEQNDEFTRAQFRAMVEPFLRDVQGRRGIQDFRVICDDTNNTPEVIDRNEFKARIMVKPTRSINFIELTFTAVRTGVSFEEIVGTSN